MNLNRKELLAGARAQAPQGTTIIAPDTTCTGELDSGNDLRVDGTIQGNVSCRSKVVIGNGGAVKGNIRCRQADITGTVVGNILAEESLVLRKGARVEGDIRTPMLQMESGVFFEGHCRMGQPDEEEKREPQPATPETLMPAYAN